MKHFQVNIISDAVSSAAKDAERLLNPAYSPMLQAIRAKDDFAYNSGTGEEVYWKIASCKVILPVFTYKPKWRWSKALGYFGKGAFHINLYRIESLDHKEIVGLLCHEWLHSAGFGHGNNWKTKFKCERSVNYFASENVGRWI